MDCRRYIDELLSAHADGELSGREERDADHHLAECAACRAQFRAEGEVKAMVRSARPLTRAPADFRMRLRAAFGDLAEQRTRRPAARRAATALRQIASASRRYPLRFAAASAALAIVALTAVQLAPVASAPATPPSPVFNAAIARFDVALRSFEPNASGQGPIANNSDYAWVVDRDGAAGQSDELGDLSRAYRDAGVPENVSDFGSAGYGLYGGRIEQGSDGYPITYTLYGGAHGDILSICEHIPAFSAPIGARYWSGAHSFYQYRDHSICITFHPAEHFVSILVSREPVHDLLVDVVSADSAA